MPNWVKHNVVIKGNKEEIARCHEQITKGEKGFSFMNIIPMPKELNVDAGFMADIAEQWNKASDEEKKAIEDKIGITDNKEKKAELQIYLDNIVKFGFPTWYEWSVHNWGTKWDACETYYAYSGKTINIGFDTAWNTPAPLFMELSKQYPSLEIYVEYADEDLGSNCGTYSIFNGAIQEEEIMGYEFACEMWGISPGDLDDYFND